MIEILEKSKTLPTKVKLLLKKGVRMTAPFSVEIGEEVNLDKIDASLIIYGAARIKGEQTLISPNVKLGYEAPVVLINCQLGNGVELKGGYFSESVFLDNVVIGSNAQVRSGCLLEEQVGGNHSVGLKQTILFPFVTLGSLVNFCDCLMGGGDEPQKSQRSRQFLRSFQLHSPTGQSDAFSYRRCAARCHAARGTDFFGRAGGNRGTGANCLWHGYFGGCRMPHGLSEGRDDCVASPKAGFFQKILPRTLWRRKP